MISNPKPKQISSGTWSIEAGLNRFTVNIPTEPTDNDLAGVIIIAKAGSAPSYPTDVVYKGQWSDFLLVDTDADNNALLPNTEYTVGVAAYDEFGSDAADVTFGTTTKDVTTLQVVTADLSDNAVTTSKVAVDAITNVKINDVSGSKLDGGTISSDGGTVKINLDSNTITAGAAASQHIKQDGATGALKFYAYDGAGYTLAIQLDSGTGSSGDPTIASFGSTSLNKQAADFVNDSNNYATVHIQNDGSENALTVSGNTKVAGDFTISSGEFDLLNSTVRSDIKPSTSGYDLGGSTSSERWAWVYSYKIKCYNYLEFDDSSVYIANPYAGNLTLSAEGIVIDGTLVLDDSQAPSSASDTGVKGEIAWDSSYIYICTATNTWKRAALSTW
jgi:hypothetical protein